MLKFIAVGTTVHRRFFPLLVLLIYLTCSPNGSAAQQSGVEEAGPYCGVYSAARMASLFEVDIELNAYATKAYVASHSGSTPLQIQTILSENGIRTLGLQKLTVRDFFSNSLPWIANVRKHPDDPEYNHWICIVPGDQGVAVYDGPRTRNIVSPQEFQSLWNGFAIVPAEFDQVATVYLNHILWIACLFAVALIVKCWPFLAWHSTARHCFSTLAVGAFCFTSFCSVENHSLATRFASAPWASSMLESVGLEKLIDATQEGCLLIDARLGVDFIQGSIPQAMSIPVDVPMEQIEKRLKEVPRHRPIIVFCQSQYCPFDEKVAKRLVALGFDNVKVSEAGWQEYSETAVPGSSRN